MEWLGWRTITEARKRYELLLSEIVQIRAEMKTMPDEFKREFQSRTLPAHLVMGTMGTGGAQVRWRLRGIRGMGQSFITLGSQKSRERIIEAAPQALRGRLLDFERRGIWLNTAVAVRDREARLIKQYIEILERQREEKQSRSE